MAASSAVANLNGQVTEYVRSKSHWRRAYERLSRDYLTLSALGIVILFVAIALLAPFISQSVLNVDPFKEDLNRTFAPFSGQNILGTDEQGRDHLSRLMYGAQVSLSIAFFAAILSLTIGVVLGMITGYFGGVVDDFLIWFITTLNSIPGLFLLLLINSVIDVKPEVKPVILILVLGLLGWTGTMRIVRGESLSLREREFIVAARAMGASSWRIMFQHIFPNLISIVVIDLAITVGVLILVESALSFLGFGIQPPIPSWGNMLTNATNYFRRAPHLIILPGLLISITVLCLYIIGDGIRDALDPTISE